MSESYINDIYVGKYVLVQLVHGKIFVDLVSQTTDLGLMYMHQVL